MPPGVHRHAGNAAADAEKNADAAEWKKTRSWDKPPRTEETAQLDIVDQKIAMEEDGAMRSRDGPNRVLPGQLRTRGWGREGSQKRVQADDGYV